MLDSFREILSAAMARLCEHSELVEVHNVDESTFRAFVLAEIRRRYPASRSQTEWHRFDLLAQLPDGNLLIEFKLYVTRHSRELDGSNPRWKGGPGSQNQREFASCIGKLREAKIEGIMGKYLVVVYEKSCPRKSRHSFAKSYDEVPQTDGVIGTYPVLCADSEKFACKAIAIA